VAYDVFASSAVAAPVVHYRRNVFEHPESAPVTFPIDLVIKDLELVQALAHSVHAAMPQAAANLASMQAASDAGLGAADMGQLAVHLRAIE
jgi:3-hydroxyisobutyrate dehydrogenase-like beta-hydroxyacid dehydrogenase